MITGHAPCRNCGKHVWNIPIDEKSKESDGNGGFWYDVINPQKCRECGEELNFLHVPPPSYFVFEENKQESEIEK